MKRTVSTHTDERTLRIFASDEAINAEIEKSVKAFATANPELFEMLRDAVDLAISPSVRKLAVFLVSGSRELADLVVDSWLKEAAERCADASSHFTHEVQDIRNHAELLHPGCASRSNAKFSSLDKAKSVFFNALQTVVAARKADEGREK